LYSDAEAEQGEELKRLAEMRLYFDSVGLLSDEEDVFLEG
jgi:hypothetical protein